MAEPGRHEPDARQATGSRTHPTPRWRWPGCSTRGARTGLPLQPRHRVVDGGVERFDDLAAHQRIGQRVQHRHRLGGRERQIEPRHPTLPAPHPLPVRGLPGARVQPGEHRPQIIPGDRAGQPEGANGAAQPPARHLPLAGVVVIETAGDLTEVVRLSPHSQLPQRQHPTRTSTPAARVWREETGRRRRRAAPWCTGVGLGGACGRLVLEGRFGKVAGS